MTAINLVCYDNGMKLISYTAFCEWANSINDSLEGEKDNLSDDLLERKKKRTKNITLKLKKKLQDIFYQHSERHKQW